MINESMDKHLFSKNFIFMVLIFITDTVFHNNFTTVTDKSLKLTTHTYLMSKQSLFNLSIEIGYKHKPFYKQHAEIRRKTLNGESY